MVGMETPSVPFGLGQYRPGREAERQDGAGNGEAVSLTLHDNLLC